MGVWGRVVESGLADGTSVWDWFVGLGADFMRVWLAGWVEGVSESIPGRLGVRRMSGVVRGGHDLVFGEC